MLEEKNLGICIDGELDGIFSLIVVLQGRDRS